MTQKKTPILQWKLNLNSNEKNLYMIIKLSSRLLDVFLKVHDFAKLWNSAINFSFFYFFLFFCILPFRIIDKSIIRSWSNYSQYSIDKRSLGMKKLQSTDKTILDRASLLVKKKPKRAKPVWPKYIILQPEYMSVTAVNWSKLRYRKPNIWLSGWQL